MNILLRILLLLSLLMLPITLYTDITIKPSSEEGFITNLFMTIVGKLPSFMYTIIFALMFCSILYTIITLRYKFLGILCAIVFIVIGITIITAFLFLQEEFNIGLYRIYIKIPENVKYSILFYYINIYEEKLSLRIHNPTLLKAFKKQLADSMINIVPIKEFSVTQLQQYANYLVQISFLKAADKLSPQKEEEPFMDFFWFVIVFIIRFILGPWL